MHRWVKSYDQVKSNEYVHECVVEMLTNAYGMNPNGIPVLRLTMTNPRHVPVARDLVGGGLLSKPSLGYCFHTFDAAIDFTIRFNSEKKTTGHGWFRVPAGKYTLRSSMQRPDLLNESVINPRQESFVNPSDSPLECSPYVSGLRRTSYCNIEADVPYEYIEALDHNHPPYDCHGNYKSLSFDIEVMTPLTSKIFPHASNPEDRVNSICAYVTTFGTTDGKSPVKFVEVFGLDTSSPMAPLDVEDIEQGKTYEFNEPSPHYNGFSTKHSADNAECMVILSFFDFVRRIRPDMITGWNIDRFDCLYLYERAKYLGISDKLNMGRIIQDKSRLRKLTFENNAFGKTEYDIITMPGVVDFDALPAAKKDVSLGLRRYDLDTVSRHLLKLGKFDMPYELITPTYLSGPDGRMEVHRYCGQDARRVWQNVDVSGWHYSYITQARATGVPLQYICFRGVQIRNLSKQLRVLFDLGFICPYIRDDINRVFRRTDKYSARTIKRKFGFTWDDRDETISKKRKSSRKKKSEGSGYSGATVIEPQKGWHPFMVGIFDFASLYPNLMREQNMCFTTIILDTVVRKRFQQGKDYRIASSGCAFVFPHVRRGVIPMILDELLNLRAQAKSMMKKCKYGSSEWAMYNGRQMGLKVTANSVYGALGTLLSQLANLDVAETVSTAGRTALNRTKLLVEEISRRRKEFGYERCYCPRLDANGNTVLDKFGRPVSQRELDENGNWKYKFKNGKRIWKIPCKLEVIYGGMVARIRSFVRLLTQSDRRYGQCVCGVHWNKKQRRSVPHWQEYRRHPQLLF